MRRSFAELASGFEVEADVVVVGSGPGGAVAADNLSAAGLRTVVVEAGPELPPEAMSRDAPAMLSRYFWDGGMRVLGGSAQIPSMQGRCLGGSSVVNSAIMLPLPAWVREEWAREARLPWLLGDALDRSYARIFEALSVGPTPEAVLGRRNLVVRDALRVLGAPGAPLPRAVKDCEGCGDCITGCATGKKQSVDRALLPRAEARGVEIFTSSEVERIEFAGRRAVGVTGAVVDPHTRARRGRFRVRAPRVVLAAGAIETPGILLRSRVEAGGRVGGTFFAHIGGGVLAVMDRPTEPWLGATQGYGAISSEVRGLKFESLWAQPSLILIRFGGLGRALLERLADVRYATVLALVYRARVSGDVRLGLGGRPKARLFVPRDEVKVVLAAVKQAADALLAVGARYVATGVHGAPAELRSPAETEVLRSLDARARDLPMTANHIFGSCRMGGAAELGPVDEDGRVRTVDGVYVADASLFPSPSAVNPQATIMALSDRVSRRLGELGDDR